MEVFALRPRRPRLLRIGPLWLRERLARRFYLQRANEYKPLFSDAELLFAPGIKLDLLPSDVSHAVIALTGLYELEVTRCIAGLARSGGLLIDVGANYGYYTCLWLGLNRKNTVLAVEASPRNVKALAANIEKNGLADRVILRAAAAGNEHGSVWFHTGPDEQSGWGGIAARGKGGDIEVPSVRIDQVFAELGCKSVEVLKVDVEGADAWVLEGAEGLLASRRIRHIFFEDNPARMKQLGIAPQYPQSLLSEFGYSLVRLTRTEWHAVAPSDQS